MRAVAHCLLIISIMRRSANLTSRNDNWIQFFIDIVVVVIPMRNEMRCLGARTRTLTESKTKVLLLDFGNNVIWSAVASNGSGMNAKHNIDLGNYEWKIGYFLVAIRVCECLLIWMSSVLWFDMKHNRGDFFFVADCDLGWIAWQSLFRFWCWGMVSRRVWDVWLRSRDAIDQTSLSTLTSV